MSQPTSPRLNFEVQHELVAKEAFIGCFVCMSFAGSFIEVVGDGVALGLSEVSHALALG